MQLCLYRATGLWHRGVGHGFGHGFGLGTGFFSLKGETKKAREFALLLLHMNRVSLVWRFSVARVILEHASRPPLVDGVVVVGGGFCVCVCVCVSVCLSASVLSVSLLCRSAVSVSGVILEHASFPQLVCIYRVGRLLGA